MSYVNRAITSTADYLPGQISEMMKQWRSFAQAKLPTLSSGHICAMSTSQTNTYVFVASADGYVYVYGLDSINGGDCVLLKQHKLDELQYEPRAAGEEYCLAFTLLRSS